MPLRCSPFRSSAFLSAHRLNSRKSTGPRTAAGKARSCLNALKHGRRASDLGRTLLAAGDYRGAALHERTRRELACFFTSHPSDDPRHATRFANQVYALSRQAERLRTKLECSSFFGTSKSWLLALFPIRITDRIGRRAVTYWAQHNCNWMWEPAINVTRGAESSAGKRLERKLRRRFYRMRRPGSLESMLCQVAAGGAGDSDTGTPASVAQASRLPWPARPARAHGQDAHATAGETPALPSGAPASRETKQASKRADYHARTIRRAQRAARKLLAHFDANGGRWWSYEDSEDHFAPSDE